MKQILLLIVLFPLFVYGAKSKSIATASIQKKSNQSTVKRLILFFENKAISLDALNSIENSLTLNKKSFPPLDGPVDFFRNWEKYKTHHTLRLILYSLHKFLREGMPQIKNSDFLNEPIDHIIESLEGKNEAVDYIIETLKEKQATHEMKFITFAYLLHDERISDEDILKFIDFMELPEDFSLSLKSFEIFLQDQQKSFLNQFFINKAAYLLNAKKEILRGRFRTDLSDAYDNKLANPINPIHLMNLMSAEENKGNNEFLKFNLSTSKIPHLKDFVSNQEALKAFLIAIKKMNKMQEILVTSVSSEIASSFRTNLISNMINDKKLNPKWQDYLGNNFLHQLSQNDLFLQEHWLNIRNTLKEDERININAKNVGGYTFLTFLTEFGSKEILQMLIAGNQEIDIFVKDIYNRSLVQIAADNLKRNTAYYFYKNGVKLNETNRLNSYTTKVFYPIVLEPIPYFSSENILNTILPSLQIQRNEDPNIFNQRAKIIENDTNSEMQIFNNFEKYRIQTIREEFLSDSLFSKLLSALYEGSTEKLADIFKKSPDIFNYKIKTHEVNKNNPNYKNSYLYLTDVLTEAIRFNQPDSVDFILEHMDYQLSDSQTFFNPLLAIIATVLSLDYHNTDARRKNEEIMSMIIDKFAAHDTLDKLNEKMIFGFDFMELIFLSGSLNLVKKLHEEYNVPLPFIESGIFNTEMSYADYAFNREFLNLFEYYKKNFKKGMDLSLEDDFDCKKIFQ